jgi:hypothetical protein
MSVINDIDAAIRAVCPIDGLAMNDGQVVRIDFRPEATPQQRADAQAVVDGFDYSPEGQAARDQAVADAAVQAKIEEFLPLMVTVMKAAGLDIPDAQAVKQAIPAQLELDAIPVVKGLR